MGFVLLFVGKSGWGENLSDFDLPALSHHHSLGGEYSSSWYATTGSGTFIVSGHRVFMFDGVHLPEEVAQRLMNLLVGAVWKEGYLLSYELFLRALWPQLPAPVRHVLRGTSQLWLLLSVYRSVMQLAPPVLALLDDYQKAWSEPRYQGTIPIAVNDAELSFRLFMQARFPEKITDPVAIDIDRVPEMANLPNLVRRRAHLNPWNRLITEMAASDIQRLQIAGSEEGQLELRFRDPFGNGGHEQVVNTNLSSDYQPVPWLLEMVRKKVPRQDIRLYASLLSQDVIGLAARMLTCRRLDAEHPVGNGQCPDGQLLHTDGGLEYLSKSPVIPSQIWEKRNYGPGRVLPLSGCDFSGQSLCWENYLIWADGTSISPWPSLTLYSRFSSFRERNSWLLFDYEPQIWYTGSYFQLRVPELVTRAFLALFDVAGQVVVNRLVTSLHHSWWGHGTAQKEPEKLSPSEEAPAGHADDNVQYCKKCDGDCRFPSCQTARCGRYKPESMVNLGCSKGGERHMVCTSCFNGIIEASKVKNCNNCGQYHPRMLDPDFYQIDPEEAQKSIPSVPRCPTCRLPFNSGSKQGTIGTFLKEECGAFHQQVHWLFSDSLDVDDQTATASSQE